MANGMANWATTELRFLHYLADWTSHSTTPEQRDTTALIVLNCPIDGLDYLRSLHAHAAFVLYADGGANRVYDLVCRSFTASDQTQRDACLQQLKPDLIHGDLDSIRDDVSAAWESRGTKVTHDPDQYSTDFGKAIGKVKERLPAVRDILILGSISGRVDQGIGLLHELLREQMHRHPDIRLWLFSESSVTVLLRAGRSIIHTPLASGLIERNVGILPLYGKAVITIKGFEWDVEDWPTELGGQVSTSNHVVADELEIVTDCEVLFTIERRRKQHDNNVWA